MLPKMPHLAFFEVISEHADEADPIWIETVSGMLLMRFFEEWLDSPAIASMNEKGVVRMRGMIDEIPNPEVRHLLGTAVTVLLEGEGGNPSLYVGPLLAYARSLEEGEWYSLAADVLETVLEALEHAPGPPDLELIAATYRKLGILFVHMRRLDDAEERYLRAISFAEAAQSLSLALEARISQIRIWLTRGNLGDAEKALAAVLDQAQQAGLLRIDALSRRLQGSVLQRQGRYGQALRELYLAYTKAPDESERELLLGDIAACTSVMGLLVTARLVHQTMAKTAANESARNLARINLLEIAVWDKDEVTFRTLLRELGEQHLTIDLDTHVRLYQAKGIECWETRREAIEAYRSVAEYAAKVGMHQIEFQALEAVERLQSAIEQTRSSEPTPSVMTPASETELEWLDVTQAIEEICNLRLHAANPTW